MKAMNQEIANMFDEIARLQEIKGDSAYRITANKRVAAILRSLKEDIQNIYKTPIKGIGKSSLEKIEQYVKHKKVKEYEKLKEETSIRQIVTHFFQSKGLSLQELKNNAKKRKIIYSRYTKPAKQLLELAGSLESAKQAIDTVANWANSRTLDYTIETVFKKWLELDRLKPKEKKLKPFFQGDPMVFSQDRKKWYVIAKSGEWLMFAGKEKDIEWKIID
jgi:DNA-binding ferritin-like protein